MPRVRRLNPLWTPGGSRSARDANIPTLFTGRLSNSVSWFEDFFATSIAPASFGVGLVATPDTITHNVPFGHPSWVISEVAGTTGTAGCTGSSSTTGQLQLISGATAGNILQVDPGGMAANSGGTLQTSHALPWIAMFRMRPTGLTDNVFGFGLVPATLIPIGTDWISDPVTILTAASTDAIVFYRNPDVTPTGGAAGDLGCYLFSPGAADNASLMVTASAAISTSNYVTYEIHWDPTSGGAGAYRIYKNAVLVGTFTATVTGSANLYRPSFGVMSRAGGAGGVKAMHVDCYYQERALASAR